MQSQPLNNAPTPVSWLDKPAFSFWTINREKLFFIIILIIAIFTRFYDLDVRVMSHDENSHVYFSWLFSRGSGYAHDPVTHGPLQFHLVALSYFMFGDNDFTARVPAALFSIATVFFSWYFRRYLGRYGSMVAAVMLLISPFLLFYGRYVRNEAFVGLFIVMSIWAILRYLETGGKHYLYWLSAITVLNFTSKETAYIFTAQMLLFLGFYFLNRITRQKWQNQQASSYFLILLIIAAALFAAGIGYKVFQDQAAKNVETLTAELPAVQPVLPVLTLILVVLGILALSVSLYFLITGYGIQELKEERSFSLMIVLFTLVLPLLTAFPLNFIGWKVPVNLSDVNAMTLPDIVKMGSVLVVMVAIAIAVGVWWNPRQWLINAGIFYAIFAVFYTTLFTNGAGLFTGLLGGLAYWLEQQGVNRGSQPIYYYALLQIPIYEYLPAAGVLLAVVVAALRRPLDHLHLLDTEPVSEVEDDLEFIPQTQTPPVFALLMFTVITSLIAYSIAGEKMPWITFHIAVPMILLSAWGVGHLIDSLDGQAFTEKKGWLVAVLAPVFLLSGAAVLGSLLGTDRPFQGSSLEQLSATSTFLTSLLLFIAFGLVLAYLLRDWHIGQAARVFVLTGVIILMLLTARTAFMAAYINYDNATEFMVYAHSAPGVKIALSQIEDISRRLTGGLDIVVAYDDDTTYPYWWYLRNYPNQKFYGANPTRDLKEASVILVGDNNFNKLEPLVENDFYRFDYIRLWWPNQDYYDLTWERIADAIRNPQMRHALFRIWLYRDYSEYATITGKNLSLPNWYPSDRMRLYVRKDIVAQLWDYGSSPVAIEPEVNPYEGKELVISAERVIGSFGEAPGQFIKPRNLAVAPDGSLYVVDTENHRIQHLAADGSVLQVWGSRASIHEGDSVPGGTFNEPWGIAVDTDGFVYVADTWNYRIQKFTPDGVFIKM
jgi:predicted membrane-bound mannosyltransferase